MIKPILMMSALALAAPAFAQSVTTTTADDAKPSTQTEIMATGDVAADGMADTMVDDMTVSQDTAVSTDATVASDMTMSSTDQSASSAYTMHGWNWSGDMGTIGTADYGTNRGMMATGSTGVAMGGPIDVDGQWASYASAGSSMLTPLEFGVWMLEANGHDVDTQVEASLRSRASNLPAVQVLNLTAGALAQADMNRDWRVSRDELVRFTG